MDTSENCFTKIKFKSVAPESSAPQFFSCKSWKNIQWDKNNAYWKLRGIDGWISFNAVIRKTKAVKLIIYGRISKNIADAGVKANAIRIVVNDQKVDTREMRSLEKLMIIVDIPESALKSEATNQIDLYYDFLTYDHEFYLYHVGLEAFPLSYDQSRWLRAIDDDKLLSEINIPGSHDAASIRKSCLHSVYSCQDRTITEQLRGGIRLFDIRIKVKKLADNGFVTCHGNIDIKGSNEYEPLLDVFRAFRCFLRDFPDEAIIVTLKIDDWGVAKGCESDQKKALEYLKIFLTQFKDFLVRSKNIPKLREVRKKIYLMNRINMDVDFGVPLNIDAAYEGDYLNSCDNRNFKIYVQDKWNIMSMSPSAIKYKLVWEAMKKKETQNEIVNMNFASANSFLMGVYVMDLLLEEFGKKSSSDGRMSRLGWILFDYPFEEYDSAPYGYINIVDFIISSNFSYNEYAKKFKIYTNDEL